MRYSFATATKRLARVSVALVLFVAPSAVVAQASAGPAACYVPGSGTIYRIREKNTPAQCGAGHVEFQLAAGTRVPSGPTGPAGGDLGGSYPNPTIAKLQGQPLFNATGAFDFSNSNGFVSAGTIGLGTIPATGKGPRFMWYPGKFALRAGSAASTEWDDQNVGGGSIAFGSGVMASGINSIAMGNTTQATGPSAFAVGASSIASGENSVALGGNAFAGGASALAFGYVSASGEKSVALGDYLLANGAYSTAIGSAASSNGMTGAFVFGDHSSASYVTASAPNQFVVRAQHYWFGTGNTTVATAGRLIETSTGAYLTSGGAWTNSSDVNRKHAFQTVDGDDVLDKIAAMPVETWSYRAETDSVRHMGPTAQDFRKAFGLGDTDKAIATVDADGVSLAAIKALLQRSTVLRQENIELRSALADVYRRLADLEAARR